MVLEPGDRVNHDKYGLGRVEEVSGMGESAMSLIDFGSAGPGQADAQPRAAAEAVVSGMQQLLRARRSTGFGILGAVVLVLVLLAAGRRSSRSGSHAVHSS